MNEYRWVPKYKIVVGTNKKKLWENEKSLYNILRKHYEDVYHHVLFVKDDEVIPYEFDIVIPSENIVIEYNGREHYDPYVVFNKDINQFFERVDRDFEKIRLAHFFNYSYIPISYDEPLTYNYIQKQIKRFKNAEWNDVLNYFIERYAKCLSIKEEIISQHLFKMR